MQNLAVRPGNIYSMGASSYSLADWTGRSQAVNDLSDGTAVFGGEKLVDVSGWYYSAMGVTQSGKLYTWGYNCYGQLGHNDQTNVYIPKAVAALDSKKVVLVCAGYEHNLILTDEGEVYGMGYNYYGQCGAGEGLGDYVRTPSKALNLDGKRVVHMSTGGYHAVCCTDKDEMYVWGQNDYFQLGIGANTGAKKTPHLHPIQEKWAHFSCGMYHTLALTREGKVYSWGDGYSTSYPCCGHMPPQAYKEPKMIETLADKMVVQVSASYYCSMCLTKDGEAYSWGYGSSYRLGFPDSANKNVPTRLTGGGLDKEKVAYVHMGPSWGQCLTEKGDIYTWGYAGPQHGSRDGTSYPQPTKVQQSLPDNQFPQHISSATSVVWYIGGPRPLKCPSRPLRTPWGTSSGGGIPLYPEAAFVIGKPENYRETVETDQKDKEAGSKVWKLRNFIRPTEKNDIEASAVFESKGTASSILKEAKDDELGVGSDPSCSLTVSIPQWVRSEYHENNPESTLLVFVQRPPLQPSTTTIKPTESDAVITLAEFSGSEFSYSLTSNSTLTNFTLTDQRPTGLGGKTSQEWKSTHFDDRAWHSILLVYGAKSKTESRQLLAYFDTEVVATVELEKWPASFTSEEKKDNKKQEVTLRFGVGLDGRIRDVAYYHYALEKKWVPNISASGVAFVYDDWNSDNVYKSTFITYDFSEMKNHLPANFELRGDGKFAPRHDDDKESPSVFVLGEGGNMKLPRGLKSAKKTDKYTLILDIYLNQLPPVKQAIFKASADSSGSADLYVDSEGRLVVLNKNADSANLKAGRLLPKKWHRVALAVDLSKAGSEQVSVYVDGALSIREQKHEKLVTGGRFALDSDFLLFQDDNTKFMLPVKLHQMQIRAEALDPKEIASITDPEHLPVLPDGRTVSTYSGSLEAMGFKSAWCHKALKAHKLERRRACDWLLRSKLALEAEEIAKKQTITAENLSLMGFPITWCEKALTEAQATDEKYRAPTPGEDPAQIGRAVQQECRDRSRMPSSA
eukprot:TRINITY_DN1930_c0_g1_i3.p1 TRINITY_DN1930_c0_g1~~TRINITY_DN1930_c0_g1_i3.p1  ORF type:complete len:1062 (+),score=161.38 TRINITY_DN1930_c0_g1_i3:138-3188(+)